MFEDPLILIVLLVALGLIGVAFVMKKKQDSSGSSRSSSTGKKKGSRKAAPEPEPEEDDDEESEEDAEEDGEWGWSAPTANNTVDDTKVSVQEVDPLTEFNVYKQFGYHEKAAESLAVYLKTYPDKVNPKLVGELVDLWLEAKKVDQIAEVLTQYQTAFPNEILADYIKKGLALDENHLGLRVLAENRLGWTVKKTAEEIGEPTETAAPAATSERPKTLGKKKSEGAQAAKAIPRKPLVVGEAALGKISNDEKGAVLSFMEPEQSVKLLKNALSYDLATKFLNKAIRTSAKPAALLIDALTLDYKAKNVDSFAEHLWHLYHSLGQSGRQVKERMLGLGYTLGEHPVFNSLEAAADANALRDIGIKYGFLDLGASQKKARHRDLVTEVADADVEARTPAERALRESESLLMYGQLDQSMDLLERAIKAYPQESQLYVALFDLYERAEEWERLERLLQDLRSQIQTLPEEVVLAMSQLLQRFNNGSFGH